MALEGVCWGLARFASGVQCRESAVRWLWRVSVGVWRALPSGFGVGKARSDGFEGVLEGVGVLSLRDFL